MMAELCPRERMREVRDALARGLGLQCPASLSSAVDALCRWIVSSPYDISMSNREMDEIRSLAIQASELLERCAARAWLSTPSPYLERVSEWTQRESDAASVQVSSRVVFVGSGPMPVSALALRAWSSASVICLDHDVTACRLSARVAERLGADIEVFCGRIETLPVHTSTHVWIASLVPDKEDILAHLAARISRSCKIVVRHAEGVRCLFNYPLDITQCPRYRVVCRLSEPWQLHDSTILELR